MKNKYIDLIEQTYEFPQEGFEVIDNELHFYGIPLMDIIDQYGTPLKISYLPKITANIQKARRWFNVAMAKADYQGKYTYCYCSKSSHFEFVLDTVLKAEAHLETSSAYDMFILRELATRGQLTKDKYIICNGFKRPTYQEEIVNFVNDGYENLIPILDSKREFDYYKTHITKKTKVGIRIASEEEPNFEFYTSRLGIRYKEIVEFYEKELKPNKQFELKMLHFFINTGIKDSVYFWSELNKCLQVYVDLKKVCPTLDSLDIGGGLPIRNSLVFDYDYEYMIEEIVQQIKNFCNQNDVQEPNLFTEFGSFTVGESGAALYSIVDQKQQNDTELWYMIDSSFITTLPDIWGINARFIMMAINNWEKPYNRVNLGGLTCDSLDYYNAEAHVSQVFLPKIEEVEADKPQYIGFFHTGAYQESLGGYGGIQHCLIPAPKHVIIDQDENGEITTRLFSKEQSYKSMLKTLGY